MFQKILNFSLWIEIPGKKKISFMRKHLLTAQHEIESSENEKSIWLQITYLDIYVCKCRTFKLKKASINVAENFVLLSREMIYFWNFLFTKIYCNVCRTWIFLEITMYRSVIKIPGGELNFMHSTYKIFIMQDISFIIMGEMFLMSHRCVISHLLLSSWGCSLGKTVFSSV